MRITRLERYKGATWLLEWNDSGELYFLNTSVVQQFQLEQDMELSEAEWEAVWKTELERKAYQYACHLLDHRGYCYREMFRKLNLKYPEDVCYTVVNRLAAYGLINDHAYAEQAAHYYVEVKQYGLYRARQEMRRRGLLDAQIEAALEPYESLTAEILTELIQRKYMAYFLDPADRKTIEKGKAALVRRGYGFSEINAAVARLIEA